MEDRAGLDKAYSLDSGAYPEGDTLYVAGTKSIRDVWDDLKIPFGLTSWSQRYGDADRVLDASPQIRRVVGHSLGGAVALELQNRTHSSTSRARLTGRPSVRSRGAVRDIDTGSTPSLF